MPPLVNNPTHLGDVYIGIDPGANGGMAAVSANGHVVLLMPLSQATPKDWLDTINTIGGHSKRAAIENNTGFVGGVGNPGSTMYKFGRVAGLLEGMLIATRIPYQIPTPREWQKSIGISPRKKGKGAESKTQFKRRLKAAAERLFPGVNITLDTADALLIAEFCKRFWAGHGQG